MTPEEFQEQLAQFQAQQAEAIRQSQLRAQAAAQAAKKKQVYGTLGALGGAALGIGLLKLLNREKGQEKAEQLTQSIGDQCSNALQDKIAGFLGGGQQVNGHAGPSEGSAGPAYSFDDEIKDADFDIVD